MESYCFCILDTMDHKTCFEKINLSIIGILYLKCQSFQAFQREQYPCQLSSIEYHLDQSLRSDLRNLGDAFHPRPCMWLSQNLCEGDQGILLAISHQNSQAWGRDQEIIAGWIRLYGLQLHPGLLLEGQVKKSSNLFLTLRLPVWLKIKRTGTLANTWVFYS